MNALTSLVQQGAKLHDSDNEESTNDTGVTESSLLFRRIEEEVSHRYMQIPLFIILHKRIITLYAESDTA